MAGPGRRTTGSANSSAGAGVNLVYPSNSVGPTRPEPAVSSVTEVSLAVDSRLPVVRRPGPAIATLFSGGYVASGTGTADRLPQPYLPAGLSLTGVEGAGEVQTPVRGAAASTLEPGDRVWLRHAKAGELAERFRDYHVIHEDGQVTAVPTYRGEGQCFG
jgi:D-serine deaminase-like pyridoxal phosphate-dependent protein